MEGIYPEEFINSVLKSLSYFKKCNIDVFDSKNSLYRKFWWLFNIPSFILNYITLTMYIVKIFTEGLDPFEKIYMIPVWLVTTQEFFVCIIIIQKEKEIRTLIEHLGSIWRTKDLTEYQSNHKKTTMKQLNFGQKIFEIMSLIVAWLYMLMPLAETLFRKFILDQEAELMLPYACVYPFAVDSWATYLGVLAFQIYNMLFVIFMYLGSNLLLVSLSTGLSIQFDLLRADLINIKPTNNSEEIVFGRNEEIVQWSACNIEEFVKFHQDVILLAQQLSAVFDKVVFLSLLFATIIVCFFAVACKASLGFGYMLINFGAIFTVMMTVLIMCYCSEQLSASSTGIAESAVKNLWYKGDLRYQTIILFIIMRSQNPCTLRTLNYFSIICASIEINFTTMEGIYPEEFINSVLKSLSYFKKCNIDVFNSKNSLYRKFWWLFNIPSFILNYITLTMYIVKIFTEGLDPFEKIYMIPVWLVTTQEFFVCIIIIQKEKEIRTLIEHLGSIWRTKDLTEYQSNHKKTTMKQLNFGQKIFEIMSLIVAWLYMLMPLAETLFRKFILDQEAELMLPYACVYPFAVDSWATYLGVLAFQIYNMLFVIFMYLGSNLLLVSLSTGLSIQFDLLRADLIYIKPTNYSEEIVFDSNDEIVKWSACNIEEFVKFHQDVILLAQQLSAVFDKIVFLSLMFATIIVCFYAVACKASLGFGYMLVNYGAIFTIMMTVLIMCYCSEQLSASSTGIAESAVKNLWYKGDLRYQTIILFIIMRSQNPCTLRTLNYFSISINTFNKVLKTTYSYFSLASQLYDARD
ncbi:hypothetical protein ABMA28_004164 [Loxostege sticticalis]|uniref:Odorant receptor n=1 Tax=Loxostege sticticalis TaxID=481309 RepID=A0ABD0SYV6_LOXSC